MGFFDGVGDFLFGEDDFSDLGVDIDREGQNKLLRRSKELSDPTYGFSQFRRLAAASTPGQADYLGRLRASGGSRGQAAEAFQAARQRGNAQAFNSFSQFRLGADRQASQLLGQYASLDQQRQQFLQGLNASQQFRHDASRTGFINSILSAGAEVAGAAI